MADKKKAKSVADVALYRCTVNLEEIFDFDLFCGDLGPACMSLKTSESLVTGENWTLELSRASPEYKKMKEERKRLTFTMPRDCLHVTAFSLRRLACSFAWERTSCTNVTTRSTSLLLET